MCGIAGIINYTGEMSSDVVSTVNRMNDALIHRGPDSDGYYHDHSCALSMRRLSIIDLPGGNQPIYNETHDILVFLNGEIYNYAILKADLERNGHQFRTQSDTEVLVHLYEEYGESMFSHLRGMFAFCLYDKREDKFIIARDRFGEKPLYYHHDNGAISFSSEIKSLLENQSIDRKINLESLEYYLRTSLIPEPLTLLKGVKSLSPGHFIRIEKEQHSIEKYFSIDYKINQDIKTDQDAIDLIKPKLISAVKSQSISDVPIGSFLSGGIDSSTMVSLLQNQYSKPVDTFNVKFEDEAFDESPIARSVAEYCGTNHHEIVIPNYEFEDGMFWDIIEHVGQPFRDSSAIPTYYISNEIKKYVKVAISGDGGDELFGGYDMFQWYIKIKKLKELPLFIRSISFEVLNLFQQNNILNHSSKIRQVQRALNTSFLPEKDIAIALNEMFTEEEIDALLKKHVLPFDNSEPYQLLKSYPKKHSDWTSLRQVMYYRTKHTLTSNMLVKVDRMSMANSLEVRAPFLDVDLFEASTQLPDKFLMRGGIGKYILREMMKDELPLDVFNHPKKGFNIPLYKYQNDCYRSLAKRLLFEENPLPNLFNKNQLERIIYQALEIKKDNNVMSIFKASHQLWMIMQLLGWAKRFKVELD